MRGEWIFSTQRLPIPIGRWGTRGETTLLLFHPKCKQNFVVVFVSFFLELESIGTRNLRLCHKIFEAWKTFFFKFLSWGLKTLFVSAGGG